MYNFKVLEMYTYKKSQICVLFMYILCIRKDGFEHIQRKTQNKTNIVQKNSAQKSEKLKIVLYNN